LKLSYVSLCVTKYLLGIQIQFFVLYINFVIINYFHRYHVNLQISSFRICSKSYCKIFERDLL